MSPIANKWKDIGVDIPSLLPLQASPQNEEQVIPYLQSLHNYLAGDRQVVVRAINVLSRYRMFMTNDEGDLDTFNDSAADDDTVIVVGSNPPVIHVCPPGETVFVPAVPEYNQITQEPTGFLEPGGAVSTMGITGTDFFIEPTGDDYTVYWGGLKFVKDSRETLDLTPVNSEGNWFIYFDGSTGELVLDGTVTLEDIIRDSIFVAELYYGGGSIQFMGEERHGLMSWQSHLHSHIADGTIHREGLGLTSMVVDGDGNTDSHAEMNAETGKIMDEDIVEVLPAMTGNWDILSRISNAWTFENTGANSPVKLVGGIPQWNDVSGAGVLSDVTNNRYFLMHIFATHILTDGTGAAKSGHVAFLGQAEYLTKNQAREGANYEISSLVTTGLPMPEFVPYGTVIFVRKGSNAYNAAVVSTDVGDDYINWLGAEIQPGNPPSSHNNLTSRDLPDQHPADSIATSTTNFDGLLSVAETEVQAALDILDDHLHDDRYYTEAEIDAIVAALDYAAITANDAGTDVTAAELEELSDGSETTKHTHAYSATGHTHLEADVTDLGAYIEDITGEPIEDLSNVFSSIAPADGEVLTWDDGNSRWDAAAAGGGGSAIVTAAYQEYDSSISAPISTMTQAFKYTVAGDYASIPYLIHDGTAGQQHWYFQVIVDSVTVYDSFVDGVPIEDQGGGTGNHIAIGPAAITPLIIPVYGKTDIEVKLRPQLGFGGPYTLYFKAFLHDMEIG